MPPDVAPAMVKYDGAPVRFYDPRPPKSVSRLSPGGIWEPVGFSHEDGLLHIAVPMGYLEPLVFRIERS